MMMYVESYYLISPPIANYIKKSKILKSISIILIKSIIKSPPKAIIFDWDNTLVNNWDPIFIAYIKTLKSLGLKKQNREEILKNAK